MIEDVAFLTAAESLPRTPAAQGHIARSYLAGRFGEIGLQTLEGSFMQPIPPIEGANLIGSIEGSPDRAVLLCAHYDACDPFGEGLPGANDNAAAVAIVLAAGSALVARRGELERRVILCLFDAEEPPYFLTPDMGSQWFVDHPPVPLDTIDMMICLDLVGHDLGPARLPPEVRESVFVLGAELSNGTAGLLDDLAPVEGVRIRRIGNHIIPAMSDYDAFNEAEIPFLFYTAGRNEHYHMPTDTPDRLNYDKMGALANHLVELVLALSVRPEPRVEFDRDGFDDQATIKSLSAVIEPLRTYHPDAEAVLSLLSTMAMITESRPLTGAERNGLAMIVFGLEDALS